MTFIVQIRSGRIVNTDPQRRCYNGCHFSSRTDWEDWRHWAEVPTLEDAERQVRLFQREDQQLRFIPKEPV